MFRRSSGEDEADMWSSVADLFGAMTLIFLVLFLLAAALVGDPSVTTIRAELVKIKKQNIVLLDEVERLKKELQRLKQEEAKYNKQNEGIVSLSAVQWAVIMNARADDPETSRYELKMFDPLGGEISDASDRSIMLSSRGGSWISSGAEQIIAYDEEAGAIYEGTYKVFLVHQKGNAGRDQVAFKIGRKQEAGGMRVLHQLKLEFDHLQPIEESTRIFAFDVDREGKISNIREF